MKRLFILVAGTIAVICGLGAVVSDSGLADAIGLNTYSTSNVSCGPNQCPRDSAWVKPVEHGIVSGFRGARPDHQGVDLGAPRGTPVRAASAGVVSQAECQAWLDGAEYSCDRDGSPQVQGCGWHVTINHADNLMTVYCHFVERPDVAVGDTVAAGDPIGTSGTSGNSSGPHLHLEVHRSYVWESSSAVDPAKFFARKGLPL